MKEKHAILLYRILLIVVINVWIVYFIYTRLSADTGPTDFPAIIYLICLAYLTVYNIYSILLCIFFFRKKGYRFYIEALFFFLLVLPIVLTNPLFSFFLRAK